MGKHLVYTFAARNSASKIACSGVYAIIDKLTSQGYDMQFGTNVLGIEALQKSTLSLKSIKHGLTLQGTSISPNCFFLFSW